jgi:hypothetical protein
VTEHIPFDAQHLGAFSQRFASALFRAFPDLQQLATMISSSERDGMSLNVIAHSPSGDRNRFVQVWVDEEATPTFGFGPSHTHFSSDDDGIAEVLDLCGAVFADQLLIIEDVGGEFDGHTSWIDLRKPEALLEEITSPYSPGTARLKSWSGVADRQVGMKDF